jgi:hypothetical protein
VLRSLCQGETSKVLQDFHFEDNTKFGRIFLTVQFEAMLVIKPLNNQKFNILPKMAKFCQNGRKHTNHFISIYYIIFVSIFLPFWQDFVISPGLSCPFIPYFQEKS